MNNENTESDNPHTYISVKCPSCRGSGRTHVPGDPGSMEPSYETCSECQGTGKILVPIT